MRTNRILIISAHPDDEVLGCGGTVASLVKKGHEVYALILGEGVTSRDKNRNVKKREREIRELKNSAHKAGKIIGVKNVFTHNFPDNRLDSVPFLDIVKAVEKTKSKIRPDIIFTHYEKDLNIDHQIVYKAVITAARPLPGETVKEIYSFEIPSSTDWNYPLTFSPDIFFDITDTLKVKLKAAEKYSTEIRRGGHSRSFKGIKIAAEYWGLKVGLGYAEAFKVVRIIK